ncbi:MAG: hypothetical protein LBG78_05815 [Azoarcus sp.]|nr:hypothetical protein [Azoarcus sp.]
MKRLKQENGVKEICPLPRQGIAENPPQVFSLLPLVGEGEAGHPVIFGKSSRIGKPEALSLWERHEVPGEGATPE